MKPAVLIVEPDDDRRRALSLGLAQRGYESVPAMGADEGLKFARGLGPSVIVAPALLMGFGDASILDRFQVRDRSMKRTLLLLGNASDEGAVPEDVLFLQVRGLSHDEIARRIRLVLVGREVGVEADAEIRSLVGDLSLTPLLELVRALHRCAVTGRLEVEAGVIALDAGDVVAAQAGRARGIKAFCRLSRLVDGPFHVVLGPVGDDREIDLAVPDLVLTSIEELQIEQPDRRAKLRVLTPPGGEEESSNLQQTLLEVIEGCESVGDLLDALPATDGRVVQMMRGLQERGMLRLETPRLAVAVVTDSTSDLPPELARSHDIQVVPLSVIFGKDRLRDGVDIQARDFYQLLESSDSHPQTQPPPEAEFFEHYLELTREQDVISVHISEKMSETTAHAREAALRGSRSFDLPPERHDYALEVVDSETVSMGLGLQALFAARMARRGLGVFHIAQRLRAIAPRIHILFGVDTLDYLVKGGRIGRARAALGKLLGIRPILGVVGGEVTDVDKVLGGRRVHPRIVALFEERLEPGKPVIVSIAHARAPVWADRLRTLIERRFAPREMIMTDIGPVVGTHTGPGCVGCVAFQPDEEEWPLVSALE
ncbi:MAG: DegV family EDD domain-containing protein [bacterium]|nr:DegV family EDD domain-containing protein [bacterium]